LPPESSTIFRQPLSAEIDSASIQWSAIRAISRFEYRNDAIVAMLDSRARRLVDGHRLEEANDPWVLGEVRDAVADRLAWHAIAHRLERARRAGQTLPSDRQ
jgi:hypothetical protein